MSCPGSKRRTPSPAPHTCLHNWLIPLTKSIPWEHRRLISTKFSFYLHIFSTGETYDEFVLPGSAVPKVSQIEPQGEMDMNMREMLTGFSLALILGLTTGIALADQSDMPPPVHGVSGICGDKTYLYVMAGGEILQYGITETELKLLISVEVPVPPPPLTPPPQEPNFDQNPPPPLPMCMPHGLWITDGFLYVLNGPMIHRYSTPDLRLLTTIDLPRPEFMEGGN